jgi:AraC-like DNA-binding protein
MKTVTNKDAQRLARRIARLQSDERVVTMLLPKTGPQLIFKLIGCYGSLRKVATASGLSPTYLSRCHNGYAVLSPGAYLRLWRLL